MVKRSLFFALWVACPLFSGHWHYEVDVGGARVELEEVPFYSLAGSDRPAFVDDPSVWGARLGGGIAYCLEGGWALQASDHYFWGSTRATKGIAEFEIVEIFPIDGQGSPVVVAGGGEQRFHSTFQQNQFDVVCSRGFSFCDGLTLRPGIGYSFLYQTLDLRSEFGGIVTEEQFRTPYHGVRIEVQIEKKVYSPFSILLRPVFGVYGAKTSFHGVQERSIRLTKSALCLRGSFEGAATYTWKRVTVGLFGFLDYLSYAPSAHNAQLLHSRLFQFGGGVAIHSFTCF